jgi:hypothetical protein
LRSRASLLKLVSRSERCHSKDFQEARAMGSDWFECALWGSDVVIVNAQKINAVQYVGVAIG